MAPRLADPLPPSRFNWLHTASDKHALHYTTQILTLIGTFSTSPSSFIFPPLSPPLFSSSRCNPRKTFFLSFHLALATLSLLLSDLSSCEAAYIHTFDRTHSASALIVCDTMWGAVP
jgi:hypothetical protein